MAGGGLTLPGGDDDEGGSTEISAIGWCLMMEEAVEVWLVAVRLVWLSLVVVRLLLLVVRWDLE